MSTIPDLPVEQESRHEREQRRVKEWERDRLIELGVERYHAELAAESGMDWHDVERLVKAGCELGLAMELAMKVAA